MRVIKKKISADWWTYRASTMPSWMQRTEKSKATVHLELITFVLIGWLLKLVISQSFMDWLLRLAICQWWMD